MPIEIFGLTLKPEISISDIAAIGALIASPLIFYFGYSRTRKSEEIKITREALDRIDSKTQKLSLKEIEDARGSSEKTLEIINTVYYLRLELEYFGYLLKTHEISDENNLKYCVPKVDVVFKMMDIFLHGLKEKLADDLHNPQRFHIDVEQSALDRIKNSITFWLNKYGYQSR